MAGTENDTTTEQILALLGQQVVEQTLSLQGIEKVKEILQENKDKTEYIKTLEKTIENNSDCYLKVRDELDKVAKELVVVKARNAELESKEQTYFEQGVKFSYESKRGDELKEILGMALRNPIITKSRIESGSVPVAVEGNGAGCMGTVYQDQKTTSSTMETVEEK